MTRHSIALATAAALLLALAPAAQAGWSGGSGGNAASQAARYRANQQRANQMAAFRTSNRQPWLKRFIQRLTRQWRKPGGENFSRPASAQTGASPSQTRQRLSFGQRLIERMKKLTGRNDHSVMRSTSRVDRRHRVRRMVHNIKQRFRNRFALMRARFGKTMRAFRAKNRMVKRSIRNRFGRGRSIGKRTISRQRQRVARQRQRSSRHLDVLRLRRGYGRGQIGSGSGTPLF